MWKKLHLSIIIIFALLLVASVGYGALSYYSGQDTVPEQVTAGGVELGGLPIDDALKKLDQYEQMLENRTITVEGNAEAKAEGSKQWKASEVGYNAEFIGVREEIKKLRTGNVWTRSKFRYHFQTTYGLKQSYDPAIFDKLVRAEWDWIDSNEPVNATRKITSNDEVVYTPHTDAYRMDVEPVKEKVASWIIVPDSQLGGQPEQALTAQIAVKTVHPEITLEKLKDEGIDRKIMEFTTSFTTSAEGRAYNVTTTARVLNDWVLDPGEVFSYGDVVKKTEEEYGYKEAPVISNGKLVPGIGGGICQVSSTLYNAILRTAGIDIVERRNHSLPVAYLPKGTDATFASGAIDFRFRNSTGKKLIIRTVVEDRQLTVKLFGTMPENIRYEIESNVVRTVQPAVQKVTDKSLDAGQQVVVQNGSLGYVVDTYRTLIKDGKEVSREKITHDTYRAQPTIVHVAPGSGGSAGAQNSGGVVEDGI
ncbi:VanW family protein [Paenibacillus glycanilyticus]|uniref:VanW family protein n=1 Tax=Paenibacillus glycanilyticus TaxID=126569 RepID=UPI00203BAF8F|nr:VanW family protein [Paenibacillus glycanilyticus]MCM3628129.1 VanW family protein [Paenibacillus glycanilyticus]